MHSPDTPLPGYKKPISVLVVIHAPDPSSGDPLFLLLERAGHPGFWQSVTGSQEGGETLWQTAIRELAEETGFTVGQKDHSGEGLLTDHHHTTVYDIWPQWRHRYAPDVTENTEHLFSFALPRPLSPTLSGAEHRAFRWLSRQEAASACFSPSNRQAIEQLLIA